MSETVAKDDSRKNASPTTPKSLKSELNEKQQAPIPEDTRLNKIQWTDGIDKLLSTWADNALCYKWLHEKATYKYSRINFAFSIPIIVLSTISGTLSVGLSGYVPSGYQQYGQAGIGAINIFAGLLTTLQNFFRPSNLSEAHRISALGWSKLYRNIANELRMQPNFRKEPNLFYKQCRTEFDRLLETQPIIPTDIIQKFKKRFMKLKNLELPDVCDTLSHTEPYKEEYENIVNDLVNSARDSNYRMTTILEGDPDDDSAGMGGTTKEPEPEQQIQKAIDTLEKMGSTIEPIWTNEGRKWRVRKSVSADSNISTAPKRMPPPMRRYSVNDTNRKISENAPLASGGFSNTSLAAGGFNNATSATGVKNELDELKKKSVVKNLSNKFKVESSGVVYINDTTQSSGGLNNIVSASGGLNGTTESSEVKSDTQLFETREELEEKKELQEIRTEIPLDKTEQKTEELNNEPQFHTVDIQELETKENAE